MDAVLFDLDDTLVDSSLLRGARDSGGWQEVFSRINEVRAFSVEAHRLPGKLREQGIKVGVVTSSPGPYARQILARFGIEFSVLVSGSDGHPPKPDPSSILAALATLGVEPAGAAYVGDMGADHAAAHLAGVTSVGALWAHPNVASPPGWLRSWPDLAFNAPVLVSKIELWPRLQPIAEAALAGYEPISHPGGRLAHPDGVSLGRYFSTWASRDNHPLSIAIRRNKHASPDSEAISRAIRTLLMPEAIRAQLHGAIITNVPPPPGSSFDRFAAYRAATVEITAGCEEPELIRQNHNVPEYKGLRGRDSRDAANAGRFTANRSLSGETVLLFDDVATSGSQLAACKAELQAAGAGTIFGVTLGYAQEDAPETCPQCGEGLLRLYEGPWGRFRGCSRYRLNGCPYKRQA